MTEVNFPHYRTYITQRRLANDAVIALLAGSRLAEHTLQLTTASDETLANIFPNVPHIERFNLRKSAAQTLLKEADSHLGAMTVPYALAIHEDFVGTVLKWLETSGLTLQKQGKKIRAWNMHEILFRTLNVPLPNPNLSLLHLLRHMRNVQIHAGSKVDEDLRNHVRSLTTDAKDMWIELTGTTPDALLQAETVTFTNRDIMASFAVTKNVARAINDALQHALSREIWTGVVVLDFAEETSQLRNSDTWMRALRRYASKHYGALSITDKELEQAAKKTGLWTRAPHTLSQSKRAWKRNPGSQKPE